LWLRCFRNTARRYAVTFSRTWRCNGRTGARCAASPPRGQLTADRLAHFLVVGDSLDKATAADDFPAEALFSSNFFAKHNDFFYYQS